MTQNRWRSPVLWTGVAAIIVLLMNNYGLWAFIGMEETVFNDLFQLILSVLVILGVVNNPTDKEDF